MPEGTDEAEPLIKLETAWAFTCPNCKQRNYLEPLVPTFAGEDDYRRSCIEAKVIEEWQPTPESGMLVEEPGIAECGGCGEDFEVVGGV